MSMSSRSDSGDSSSLDIQELLHIGERCRKLRKEKELLKESQSESYEFVKRLELHVKRINEAHSKDRKQIQDLQRELNNCYEEIDYLQDQLNKRNTEAWDLGECVRGLENQDDVVSLKEELNRSNLEVLLLKEEIKSKNMEIQKSLQYIDKLEESISFAALESQCEIECLKLDLMSLEQSSLGLKRHGEEVAEEKIKRKELIAELETQIKKAHKTIGILEAQNRDLRGMLDTSSTHVGNFVQRIEKHLESLLNTKESLPGNLSCNFSEHETEPTTSTQAGMYGDFLAPLLSKLLSATTPAPDLVVRNEQMSRQIYEYENIVRKLKEELQEEKLKAKEDGEDLVQEMAELRYQLTGMLEEERKHRACIEQASLRRINELEAQLRIEKRKSIECLAI